MEKLVNEALETICKNYVINKANLRDLIAATGLVILLKLDLNRQIFQPVWPWNLMDDPPQK